MSERVHIYKQGRMKKIIKVGVIFCGGCNSYFDRELFYTFLKKEYESMCDFCFYKEGSEGEFDIVILINGCQSECVMQDIDYMDRLLIINNTNYEKGIELLSQYLHLL